MRIVNTYGPEAVEPELTVLDSTVFIVKQQVGDTMVIAPVAGHGGTADAIAVFVSSGDLALEINAAGSTGNGRLDVGLVYRSPVLCDELETLVERSRT